MRLRPHSLLVRILALHVLAVAAVSIAMIASIHLLLNATLSTFEQQMLRRHETPIAAALERTATGWTLNLPPRLAALYEEHYGGFSFIVSDAAGRVLFASPAGAHAVGPPVSPSLHATYTELRRGGADDVTARFPERRGAATAWVQVTQNLADRDAIADDIVAAFLREMLWFPAALLLLLFLVDVIIVRQALAPVVHASHMAGAIAPARMAVRLPARGLPSEIVPLVEAVNQALDRLEAGFRIQREFTADAAHELRTPLSILRMRIGAHCEAEAARALQADIDAMARIVGQLLAIAELDNLTLDPTRRTDLRAVGEEVAAYLAPLAAVQGKAIAFDGPPAAVWVRGDPSLLFQALRNLAENAIRHTPAGDCVEIEVDGSGMVRVLDRGPGVAAHERELVFRRFWRRERSATSGAGLGLSIVARIAEAHGASIDVHDRDGGGAAFEMKLVPAGGAFI